MTGPLQLAGGVELPTVVRAVTALVGFFVAYQAYRGYRRNDSRPMLFLGVGIGFVTTVSFVVSTLVARPLGASDALAFLSWTCANVVGLAAIFYAFTGAAGGGDRDAGRSARSDGPGTNEASTDGGPPTDEPSTSDGRPGGGDR